MILKFTGFPFRRRPGRSAAFTRMELIVVLVVAAFVVLLVLLWPPLSVVNRKAQQRSCLSNLKQIGTAFQLWSTDHNDLFPMQVSTDEDGALEPVLRGEAFRVFQVLSNELNTPKILVCPADDRLIAFSFQSMLPAGATGPAFTGNSNVNYFVGVDAKRAAPASWLAGDGNLTIKGQAVGPSLLTLTNRPPVGWTPARHQGSGNLLFADGSAQRLSSRSLSASLATNLPTATRLAIP